MLGCFWVGALLVVGADGAATDAISVDVVPFGELVRDEEGYTVIWEDPRELHRVVVGFETPPPPNTDLSLEYWQSSWPFREIPRDAPSGSGFSGWFDVGDWYKGKWQTADTDVQIEYSQAIFTFNPANRKEFPDLSRCDARYRTTLKLRVPKREGMPDVRTIAAYTDTLWYPLEFVVETSSGEPLPGRLEVFNGVLNGFDGRRGYVRYAVPQHYGLFDTTVVTYRGDGNAFSFAPEDLVKWRSIFLPDFGVLIRLAEIDISYEQAARDSEHAPADIYSRVFDMPEQTLPNAWADMPAKGRHYIPLSFEGTRQHFGLDGEGNVFRNRTWINRLPGRDTERCHWRGDEIWCTFGLPSEAMKDRTLVDGCLPMTIATWEREGIRYTQTAFAAPLAGVPVEGERVKADEPMGLYVRFTFEPVTSVPACAHLRIESSDKEGAEPLALQEKAIVAGDYIRAIVSDTKGFSTNNNAVDFQLDLMPDASSVSLDLVIPFITLRKDDPEMGMVLPIRFDRIFDEVRSYWRNRIASGARIHTPENMINEFYDAHVSHLLINTEREVTGSLRYMARVGTFGYGVFANEACMMVTDLDRRGFHKRAEEAIETWLHYQGKRHLPGDYRDADGVFYSAGGYEDDNGYNQHHGWVLWCIGEHYWYTRDDEWLARAKPHILKACAWITRERKRTVDQAAQSSLRAIEYGLLPPGSLEDIADWRCWLSNNVYAWWGMDNAARALKIAGHAEADSLLAEADAYRKDIRAAFTEAMWRSPVVRLRNGRWIPQVPSEVHRRGRSFGWITQTLEGAIHLVRCGVLEPNEKMSDWIIQDYEDNLYLSEEFGYLLIGEDFDRYWFSRGGISQQANLLCNPIPYLLRDEVPHFLRAYFNAFAVSYFPDTRMMTEHALPNMGDFRGDHYKTSDETNSTYWLRMMFVHERGDDLWIGAAIPRYWLADGQCIGIENAATYFGPLSVSFTADVAAGNIMANLIPPRRNPPERIIVRFRHPDGRPMTRCEVNGSPWNEIDVEKEYVVLPAMSEPITVVAYY